MGTQGVTYAKFCLIPCGQRRALSQSGIYNKK